MMHAAVWFGIGQALTAQPLDTDILASKGGNAKVILVVDESGSMGSGSLGQVCTSGTVNTKEEQLKAALNGCIGDEGVLDLWSSQVEFALMGFRASTVTLHSDFTQNLATLESAVNGLTSSGLTPLSRAIREAGKHHQDYWSGPNLARAQTCDDHYLVTLSDGYPNSVGATMDYACDGSVPNVNVPEDSPELASAYLANNGDMLCSLDGEQVVSTFTIGFGNPGDFSESQLDLMAQGEGFYQYASDTDALAAVFNTILQAIVNRGAITFGSSAVSNDGFFTGNDVFISAFKPIETGAWLGNLKKTCIVPDQLANGEYDATQRDCLFRFDTAKDELVTNVDAKDVWSLQQGLGDDEARLDNAMVGGAGARIFAEEFGGEVPEASVGFSDFYTRRSIYTWDPSNPGGGYIRVTPSDLSNSMTGVAGCTHHKLIAMMHGYDIDSFDCSSLEPQHFAEWPIGAIINSGSALMAYAEGCDSSDPSYPNCGCYQPGNCVVAVGSNHGMVSFVDAATGNEITSIVPGDLWKPGMVTPRGLADLLNQPNINYKRLPTVDGNLRLYHLDENSNAVIEPTEDAYLVAGLGHGGSAYYFIDVSEPIGDTPSASQNPVVPLVRTPLPSGGCSAGDACWTDDLRSTQAAPAIGRGRFIDVSGSNADRTFAAFTSGGDWEVAEPDATFEEFPGSYTSGGAPGAISTTSCTDMLAGLGLGTQLCNAWNPFGSYDALVFPGGGSPFDSPYTVVADDVEQITGVTFDYVDLEPGDQVRIQDTSGVDLLVLTDADNSPGSGDPTVQRSFLTSQKTAGGDAIFRIRFETDGAPGPPVGNGIKIREFEVRKKPTRVADGHRPFLAVIDLERMNGPDGDPRREFVARTKSGAELLLVTRDCADTGVDPTRCIDASDHAVLDRMVCPISAPPSVYSEGGLAKAFYFGDWCGQLWKVYTEDQGQTWKPQILLELNEQFDPSSPTPGVVSRNFRRFERPVDLFVTGCKGGRALGVSFGTGNVNRAGADDDLDGASAVTNHHAGFDVVGTLFDDGTITAPVRLNESTAVDATCAGDCLVDLTNQASAADKSATGYRGFFWALREDERMLRDPLTVEGVTFYPTFQVDEVATACDAGVGIDRVYAVRNCDADPVDATGVGTGGGGAQNQRTVVENTDSVIGAGLAVFTPPGGEIIVSTGNIDSESTANLLPNQGRRGPRMLYWHKPEL